MGKYKVYTTVTYEGETEISAIDWNDAEDKVKHELENNKNKLSKNFSLGNVNFEGSDMSFAVVPSGISNEELRYEVYQYDKIDWGKGLPLHNKILRHRKIFNGAFFKMITSIKYALSILKSNSKLDDMSIDELDVFRDNINKRIHTLNGLMKDVDKAYNYKMYGEPDNEVSNI